MRDNALEGARTRRTGRGAAFSSMFLRFRPGGKPGASCGNSDKSHGGAEAEGQTAYAAIAAISGLTPTMFMTRVRL